MCFYKPKRHTANGNPETPPHPAHPAARSTQHPRPTAPQPSSQAANVYRSIHVFILEALRSTEVVCSVSASLCLCVCVESAVCICVCCARRLPVSLPLSVQLCCLHVCRSVYVMFLSVYAFHDTNTVHISPSNRMAAGANRQHQVVVALVELHPLFGGQNPTLRTP